jgi:tetratricopeptide (TPR) repeat protein
LGRSSNAAPVAVAKNVCEHQFFSSLLELNDDKNALVWLKKAVALAPNDPIDNWNLGSAYEDQGNLDSAQVCFQRSVELDDNPETRNEHGCQFADFMLRKRHDTQYACKLEKQYCPKDKQDACADQL